MKRLLGLLAVVAVAFCAAGAWAANSVVVESRVMGTNSVDCPIHVRIVNDVSLIGLAVPLVIREVTPGTYISALKSSWSDRLYPGGPFLDYRITQQFAEPNGTCAPGGFAPPFVADDTLKHPVAASPECALFAAISISAPELPPGSDVTGSIVLWVDVTGPEGSFEIDTTCTYPNSHLLFVRASGPNFVPAFTKGVITTHTNTPPIAMCRNVAVATGAGCVADASIDNGSFDPDGDAISMTQVPPGPYPVGQTAVALIVTDANCTADTCTAVVTVQDITPPIVTCAYDTVIVVAPGEAGAIVEFESSATDECSSVTAACNPPSGSYFPVGVSTVTCIATDAAGNADTCHFFVAIGSTGYCNDRPEDVNCDGFLDVFDLSQIIDAVFLGVPESGPCCSVKK